MRDVITLIFFIRSNIISLCDELNHAYMGKDLFGNEYVIDYSKLISCIDTAINQLKCFSLDDLSDSMIKVCTTLSEMWNELCNLDELLCSFSGITLSDIDISIMDGTDIKDIIDGYYPDDLEYYIHNGILVLRDCAIKYMDCLETLISINADPDYYLNESVQKNMVLGEL